VNRALTATRYTRIVSGHPPIVGAVLLAVLTSLPVAGGLCAVLCGSSVAAPTPHHHDGMAVQRSHRENLPVQIAATSAHDCATHGGILQGPALAGGRFDRGSASTWPASIPAGGTSSTTSAFAWPPQPGSPPERPPARPPTLLVLRV
jgi:hypothetical protein